MHVYNLHNGVESAVSIALRSGSASLPSMQATLPPAWAQAERLRRRRGRVALAELGELTARAHQLHLQMTLQELRRLRELHARLGWPRAPRPEVLLYTPNQLRQLIRLSNVAESASQAPAGWRPGPLGAPWHLPDTDPSQPESMSGSAGGGGGAEWWSWRGWGAGALLLVAALLLARATDRCFTTNYARSRRRRSEEWPTPNVLATSQQNPASSVPAEEATEAEAEEAAEPERPRSVLSSASGYIVCMEDLPPPYSEVAAAGKHARREEPPPPYSDCYVTFSNPKDGVPSVRFLDGRQQSVFDDAPASSRFNSVSIAHHSNYFNADPLQAHNPLAHRMYKIPYADSSGAETASEGEDEGARAPLASEDMRVALHAEDDDVSYISVTDVFEARRDMTVS
ncbi:unnamed protein product, partial [Brenthis ino]